MDFWNITKMCLICGNEFQTKDPKITICADCLSDPEKVLSSLLEKGDNEDNRYLFPGYQSVRQIGGDRDRPVFLVISTKDGSERAAKCIRSMETIEYGDRYEIIALKYLAYMGRIAMALHHPNIVETYSVEVGSSTGCILMDYCPGGSVRDLADTYQNSRADHKAILPVELATEIIIQVLDALDYAHTINTNVEIEQGRTLHISGLLHGNIKPEKILLCSRNCHPIVKITGFSALASSILRREDGDDFFGDFSPMYMSKAYASSIASVKPVFDVWSTAASFYELLTGELPRDRIPGDNIFKTIFEAPIVPIRERNPEIPDDLATVIDDALYEENLQSDMPYKTAVEFKEAILKAV